MSDVDFKIGATSKDADAAFEKVAQQAMSTGQRISTAMREASYKMASDVKSSVDKINTEFGKVIEQTRKMQGVLLAVGAALAGGKAFKETVDETIQMTKEATQLSRALGITVTEASGLNVALGDIYQSADTLLGANAKLTKQLNTDEDAFKKLGVATRDQNGHFRNSLDIMLDVNTKLLQFKEGTDRNIEGVKIYGKGWQDAQGILKLTTDRMAESKAKADELGLSIGVEGVKRVADYRASMNDVGDVLQAVKKVIGDALMPVLAQMGDWFSSTGPYVVTAFKGAIGGLVSVFHGLVLSFKIAWEFISLGFKNMTEIGSTFGKVMWAVLKGDFKGASEAASAGMAQLQTNVSTSFDKIVADATTTQEKIRQLFSQDTAITQRNDDGKTSEGGNKTPKKVESRTGKWDEELAAMRDAYEKQKLEQGSFEEFSKAKERDYWKNILDTVKLTTEERRTVSQKYYALEREIRKSAFDAELQDMKNQQALLDEGSLARVTASEAIAKKVGEKYGLESKEYKAAQDEIRAMATAHQKQMDQLGQMEIERTRDNQRSLIDLERVHIEESAALGIITNTEKLQKLALLKDQEFELDLKAAQDRAALANNDVIAYQQAMDKILEIKRKHELDKANVEKEIKVSQKKDTDDLFDPLAKGFEKVTNSVIQNQQTLRGAIRNGIQSILLEYSQMGVKMAVQWLANQARMTAATAAGTSARTTIEAAGASKSMAISGATSFKSIMNDAYEAMAGAYKAIAGIPFVGPYLAPVVAAGAFAGVATLAGSVMSSRGGDWQIPSDRLNIVHANETILPADKSAGLDKLITDGGSAGSAPIAIYGSDSSTMTIGQLKKMLTKMNRNFVHVNK